MVSGCPFLIQVTLVAGEPVEIQVRVEDMDPRVTDVMLGVAGEEYIYTYGNTIQRSLKYTEQESKFSGSLGVKVWLASFPGHVVKFEKSSPGNEAKVWPAVILEYNPDV